MSRLAQELSLKARLELFATNITVLEMRWQHIPNLGCRDAETARTITRGASTWYNRVIVASRAKPRTKGNRDDRWTDVAEVHWWSAMPMDTVVRHQRNFECSALRHGQPVTGSTPITELLNYRELDHYVNVENIIKWDNLVAYEHSHKINNI